MLSNVPRAAATLAVALLSLTLTLVPFRDFYQNLYSWHFHQPGFVQGGLELLAIAAILFFCGFIRQIKLKYLLLAVLSEVYLRRHNADLAALIAFLFADSLIGLGYFVCRGPLSYRVPTLFIVGSSIFVLFALALSPFGWARMELLLAFSAIVLIVFYAIAFRESLLFRLGNLARYVCTDDHLGRLVSILLYVCILMLAAKTAYENNYDESWYSLRPMAVLNPHGNFFEDLKLLGNWVHQYPKFLEILQYPLGIFESFTVSKIFSVAVLVIGLIAASEFWESCHLSTSQKTLMSIVLISLPVVTGTATSAKPDFFAGFVFLLSTLYFLKGTVARNMGYLLISAGMLMLTSAIKQSALPYMPILLALYAYAIFDLRGKLSRANRTQMAMSALFIFTFGLVTWRTFIITGVPFAGIADLSPTLGALNGLLGMEYKYPYGPVTTFANSPKIDSLTLLFRTFMLPTGVRQSFTWISNIAIPLMALAIVWRMKSRFGKYEAMLLIFFGLMMMAVIGFVFNNAGLKGGDGNYYLIPMMIMVVVGASAFKWVPEYAFPITIACLIYAAASLPIAFVSSMSWHIGTRGFDLVFKQQPFNKKEIQRKEIEANALTDVNNYFSSLDMEKCVALVENGNNSLYNLGCRMETAGSILGTRAYLNSGEAFARMLKEKKVTYLLVQSYYPDNMFGRLCRFLADRAVAKVSRFKYYDVIDIRDIQYDELKRLSVQAERPDKAINIGNQLPYTVRAESGNSEATIERVLFAPPRPAPRAGVMKYYSAEDSLIFIQPETVVAFPVDTSDRCVSGVAAYLGRRIDGAGQQSAAGKFIITASHGSQVLGEGQFSIKEKGNIRGYIPLGVHSSPTMLSFKYVSTSGLPDQNIPAMIINPRLIYCD